MFPEIDKCQLGQRLKDILKEKRITARDVQEYLSLSCVQTVYRWIEGVNIPCIDHLYALSILMDISIDYLVAGKRRRNDEMAGGKEIYKDFFLYREDDPEKKGNGYAKYETYTFFRNESGDFDGSRIRKYMERCFD